MTGDYPLNQINCCDFYNPIWQPIWVIPPYTPAPVFAPPQPPVYVTWTITQASIDADTKKEIAALKKRVKKLEAKK